MEDLTLWTPLLQGAHFFDDFESLATSLPDLPSDPVAFVRDTLGWIPDPKQEDILRSKSKRIILCMGRRCGKTYTISAKAVHFALTHPGSQTIVFSRSQPQANIVIDNCQTFLRSAGIPFRGHPLHRFAIRLPNEALIFALAPREATLRGFTPNLVVMDEAARIPDKVYDAITPMLGLNNPSIILLSSPWDSRGFFYEEWISSEPWDRFFAPTTECPRYDKAHLEYERRRKPESVFRREFLCEFLDAEGVCFPEKLLRRAVVDHPMNDLPRMTRQRDCFIAGDLGRQNDPSTIAVIERLELLSETRDPITMSFPAYWQYRLVYLERLPLHTPYTDVVQRLCSVTRQYPKSHLLVDATGVGMPVVDMLRAARPDAILHPLTITGGNVANTSGDMYRVPKRDLVAHIQLMLESNTLRISNRISEFDRLMTELRTFRMKLNARAHDQYGAPDGEHDDLVMAVAMAAYKAWKP